MVTISEEKMKKVRGINQYALVEIKCLSTDDKPISADGVLFENGSSCIEIDTGKIFLFDLEHEQWKEI